MFQILGIISELEVSFTSGIYSIVAKIYDMMVDLATRTDALPLDSLTNLIQTCYVLAGVFMLFRTVIGLIQMLVNPDKVNDGNVGAGKLISRIIVSIILLLLLQPQGILFNNSTGLFPRIERALLNDEDGLITRMGNNDIEYSSSNSGSNNSSSVSKETIDSIEEGSDAVKDVAEESWFNAQDNMSGITGYLIEDVYADTGDLSCYYFGISEHKGRVVWSSSVEAGIVSGRPGMVQTTNHEITIDAVYKIDFFKSKKNANKGVGKAHQIGNTPYYYKVRSGTNIGGKEKYGKYSSLDPNAMSAGVFKDDFPSKCPVELKLNNSGKSYSPRKNYVGHSGITTCEGVDGTDDNGYKNCTSVGILGGFSSYAEMKKTLDDWKADANYGITGVGKAADFVGQGKKKYDESAKVNGEYLSNLRRSSVAFAQGAASSFHTCAKGHEDECKEIRETMFTSSEANDELDNLIDKEILDISFIISMVFGIFLMGYLLLLCVDVIVRRLKLTLLQVMAPLPAISYVDPNDKIFNQWAKIYIATYLDLFIKLIAIALAMNLLQAVLESSLFEDNLLYRLFYIIAVLVFAKLVPSLISKIFGLDSMGGSFKDILGMGKAAAGFGAGAVIGGAVGAATGKGLGIFTGLTKGAMMGAGSGAKGNITGGAKKIAAANKLENDGKTAGLNFFQRKMAGATAALGVQDAYSKAKAKKQVSDDFVSKASAYEDESLNKVNKVIGNGYGNKFKNLLEARNDAQKAAVNEKVSLLREVDNGDGTTSFVNKLTGENYATYNTDSVTDDIRSHFLSADNYSMSAAEAQARVKGEEKKASKQLRDDLAKGNFKEYGFKENDADLAEMSSLKQAADTAAVRAGYKDGYTKDNKDAAKRASAEAGSIMDRNEAAHMYSERK